MQISHPQKQKVNLDKLEQETKHTQSFALAHGCFESYSRTFNRRYFKGSLEHLMLLNSAHEVMFLFFTKKENLHSQQSWRAHFGLSLDSLLSYDISTINNSWKRRVWEAQ